MPLDMEIGRGPGHIVLDGESSAIPAKGAQQPLPLFGPCLLWPRSPILATAELLLVIMSLFFKRRLPEFSFCRFLRYPTFRPNVASVLLWSPYVIGQAIIFCPVASSIYRYLSFFLALISAVYHILHMVWPSCELRKLECRSEICCTRLAGNAGPKNRQKIAICAPSHN